MAEPWKDKAWLEEKYWRENLSLKQIADIVGADHSTVRYQMQKLGIPRRTLSQSKQGRKLCLSLEQRQALSERQSNRKREKSSAWKGGHTVIEGRPYIYAPDHPMAKADGYIQESRLVMSEALGRTLSPDEVVHHIDGDPFNNHFRNLRLTSRSQHARRHLVRPGTEKRRRELKWCEIDGCPEPATKDSSRCVFHMSDWQLEDRLAKLLDEKVSGIERAIKTLVELEEQKAINIQFREHEQRGSLEDIRRREDQLMQGAQQQHEAKRQRFEQALKEAPKVRIMPFITEIIQINGVKRHLVAGLLTEVEKPFADEFFFRETQRREALILEGKLAIDPDKPLESQDKELGIVQEILRAKRI